MSYQVWDIETTTRKSFKRTANPFDAQNFVVMSGHKVKGGQTIGEYFGRGVKPFDWFTKLLKDHKLLVGQNIKFDLLYALREPQNLEAWMQWVADGGNVWDCQLAEYLLDGMPQESHMLSMDELAPRYGGNLKFDEVKMLWKAGVDTADIDEELLTRYLVGTPEEHGDIGNTEVIFLGQLARARDAKQVKSIMLNMGSLLCTIEMERNGMAIDEELGRVHQAELTIMLAEVKRSLEAFLPADLPFEFQWTNRYHLSPLLFGGTVKYEIRMWDLKDGTRTSTPVDQAEDKSLYMYAGMDEEHYVLEDGGTISKAQYAGDVGLGKQVPALAIFKAGKNAGEAKTKKVRVDDYTKPKSAMREFFHEFPRMTEPKNSWKSSTPGLWSVASEIIDELALRDIPFLQALGKVQTLSKDLGTYYFTEDDKGNRKGMLTLVDNGIIHHSINHTSTVTGRFSSSDPNLQNISKGQIKDDGTYEGSRIKLVFVSRWRDEGQIVQSDFTSLEVYVQAILTKCQQLIDDLKAGLDMHCARVATKEKIPYEEALLRCVGNDTQKADPVWKKKRTEAKVFSFQRAYGAGAQKISDSTGIPLDDVNALITAEDARYPEVPAYYTRLTMQIDQNRVPTSRFCAHPDFPAITCQLGRSSVRTPDGKLYTYQEQPTPKFVVDRTGKTQGFSPTEIKNYVVQGGGGEWAKAAMWLAVRAFYKRKNFGHLALLVNQVHDALYADMHKTVRDEASALLHACMEGASDFMEWYFDWNVPVPVPSVTESGPNMLEADVMQAPEWQEQARAFRLELRSLYMNNYTPSFEINTERKAA